LLLGAGLAVGHDGAIPLVAIVLGLALLLAVIWSQGLLGLLPPWGEGANLTQVAQRYFTPAMQQTLAVAIAVGMTGWYGVNVGMGAAALSALIDLPQWATSLLIGVPILLLSLRGLAGWNRLAIITTASVLTLVGLVMARYAAGSWPRIAPPDDPARVAADMAVMLGYVGVFSVRTPDFTAGLARRRDLAVVAVLLAAPLTAVVLGGALLGQHTGSADPARIMSDSQGMAWGNLLIALAVIAPTFTTFYSGAPALRAATGIGERPAMLAMAVVGLALAAAHFDLWLLPWLGVLGAMVPPVIVPLAVEFSARRRGHTPRRVPMWPWLIGAAAAFTLALARHPLAMATGFVTTGAATAVWRVTR
jgi:hypothetical protein